MILLVIVPAAQSLIALIRYVFNMKKSCAACSPPGLNRSPLAGGHLRTWLPEVKHVLGRKSPFLRL